MNDDENQDLDVLSYSVRFGIKRESRQSDEEQLVIRFFSITPNLFKF
jgi:hypothetical protein